MAETPEYRELLTHITYIREGMDEMKGTLKGVVTQANGHETRIVKLEERTPSRKKSGFWGTSGFITGVLAGLGIKAFGE